MKKIDSIKLETVPGFGKLLKAYLFSNDGKLPLSDNFDKKAIEKRLNFRNKFEHRIVLHKVLTDQNKSLKLSEKTKKNIALIKESNTVCITTGHQLALMGGPLFVAYKILTTIKLTNEYAKLFPDHNFVPVFWLASEDHDKEEIDHFSVHGKNFHWETEQTGAVGNFKTDGILALIEKIETEVNGLDTNLLAIFKKAYALPNFSDATRFLVNELFGEFGIVIIDGNNKELKNLFLPIANKEINDKIAFVEVNKTNAKLKSAGFEPAINPRELNLFLLTSSDRKRLEFSVNGIKTADDSNEWTKSEFLIFANENPEKISPNVLLRPVYQETVLPNIAYIGGPAETEYWLQLDDLFLTNGIETPQRVLRICNTLVTEKNIAALNKIGLELADVFEDEEILSKKITTKLGGDDLDFTKERKELSTLFEGLSVKAKNIDVTMEGTVKAEYARQEKALENVFAKLMKAEKTKQEVQINKVLKIRNGVLPNGKPQERTNTLFEINEIGVQDFFCYVLENVELNMMNVGIS